MWPPPTACARGALPLAVREQTETETFSGVNAALQGDMPHTRRCGLGLAIAQPAAPRAGPGWPRAPARCSPRVSKATELQVLATSHPSGFC